MHCLILLLSVATAIRAASSPVRLESKSTAVEVDTKNQAYKKDNALHVPMNETASEELFEKWLSQAMSGFMAALASKRLEQMGHEEREEVHACSKKATTVPEHARCVVKVLDSTTHGAAPVKDTPVSHLKSKPYKGHEKNKDLEWTGSFGQARAKRQTDYKVITRNSYKLKTMKDEPLMTQVAKQLTRSVRKLKNKSTNSKEGWRHTVMRVKKVGEEAKKEKKQREDMKKRLKMMIDNTPEEFVDPRKPIAMKKMEMEDEDMALKKMVAKKQKDEIRVPMQLMREAVRAAMEISGQNTTGFEKKTLKLFSPRFMSIVPEQEQDSLYNLLSPSLFSLHEEGKNEEQLFSLPKILKKLNNQDQEAWMDFIIEASGVTDAVDKTEQDQKKRKEREMRGDDGTPLFFTKQNMTDIGGEIEVKKIEVFEQLDKSYNDQQKNDLDKQGFAFLTDEQLEMVYGTNSPYKKPSALKRFKSRLMRDDPHKMIETDIRALAEAEKFKVRRHDISMFWLFVSFSIASALDPNPTDINKVCYKCNVYSAAGKMKCENPGVCYANFCYSYVTSDGTTMFLSGCAEDITDYPLRDISDGIVCQASSGLALCVCATGKKACNFPEEYTNKTETMKNIHWVDIENTKMDNISSKVTGFSMDYANRRMDHLIQDGIEKVPKHFNLSRITNFVPDCGRIFIILSLVLSV